MCRLSSVGDREPLPAVRRRLEFVDEGGREVLGADEIPDRAVEAHAVAARARRERSPARARASSSRATGPRCDRGRAPRRKCRPRAWSRLPQFGGVLEQDVSNGECARAADDEHAAPGPAAMSARWASRVGWWEPPSRLGGTVSTVASDPSIRATTESVSPRSIATGVVPSTGGAGARAGRDLVPAGERLGDDAGPDHPGGPDDGELHAALL